MSENWKLKTVFISAIFNHCQGLDPPTEQEAYEATTLLNIDAERTREQVTR